VATRAEITRGIRIRRGFMGSLYGAGLACKQPARMTPVAIA
jgi:hypothetical protein